MILLDAGDEGLSVKMLEVFLRDQLQVKHGSPPPKSGNEKQKPKGISHIAHL